MLVSYVVAMHDHLPGVMRIQLLAIPYNGKFLMVQISQSCLQKKFSWFKLSYLSLQ